MRSRDKHDDGGGDGVQGQPNQTEPVDDHGGELPVGDDHLVIVPVLHLLGDQSHLPQDQLHLLKHILKISWLLRPRPGSDRRQNSGW